MKIVLTIHHPLNPDSGAAGTVLRLAEEYRLAGHAVAILSFDCLPDVLPDVVKGLIFPFFVAWRLFIRDRRAEIVDASSGDAWLLYCLPLPRTTLRVTHSHGLPHASHAIRVSEGAAVRHPVGWWHRLYRGGLELWLDTLSLRGAHLALLLNRGDRGYAVERLGLPPSRLAVVPNGLPEHFYRPAAAARLPGPFVIAQIGSYIARKGVETTRDALVPLMRGQPDIRLHFLGTGIAEEVVRADYPADLQERLRIVPAFRNTELPDLLEGASVVVMPSTSEGFGLAALEGMACGLVPVTSDIPGPTEYVRDGENGSTFPSGRADALRACIARLHGQPGQLREMRERAIRTAAAYRLSRIAAERLDLYEVFRSRLQEAPDGASTGSRLAAFACVVTIVVLAWLPGDLEEPLRSGLPGQVEHFIAYFGAASVLRLTWRQGRTIPVAVGFILLAAILEVGQIWIPGRNAQFVDFVASSLGAVAGLGAGRVWLRRTRPARA